MVYKLLLWSAFFPTTTVNLVPNRWFLFLCNSRVKWMDLYFDLCTYLQRFLFCCRNSKKKISNKKVNENTRAIRYTKEFLNCIVKLLVYTFLNFNFNGYIIAILIGNCKHIFIHRYLETFSEKKISKKLISSSERVKKFL